MRIFLARAKLAAAIIVPQMIVGMVFVIIPVTQGILVRLAMRRQAAQD